MWQRAVPFSTRARHSRVLKFVRPRLRAFAEASNSNDTNLQVVNQPSSVTVGSTTAVSVPQPKALGESIEDILIRSKRNEIIERIGPQVVRYLPSEDPNSLLIPDSRLEPHERKWQKVFVALPWAVFACMLAAPLLLVRTNLPWLQKKAEEDREAMAERNAMLSASRTYDFEIIGFMQMPDILERPFPTIVLLFHADTFSSKVFLPAMRDIFAALKKAGLTVSVAALDLSADPCPPDSFLWEYPRALAPHLQIVIPRARDGEAGVVDYKGRWNATGIVDTARKVLGPGCPRVPQEEIERLDSNIKILFEALFDLMFVEDGTLSPRSSSGQSGSTSWMSWVRGQRSSKAPNEAHRSCAMLEAELKLDLQHGLSEAIASCQVAGEVVRQRCA